MGLYSVLLVIACFLVLPVLNESQNSEKLWLMCLHGQGWVDVLSSNDKVDTVFQILGSNYFHTCLSYKVSLVDSIYMQYLPGGTR